VAETTIGRLEDRHDRPVAEVECSVAETPALECPEVVERRALRRRLLRREERVRGAES
jgi:hypothetical protein